MGSISELYDSLQQAAMDPVAGNQHGSHLTMTMKSNQGLVFGAARILSGFVGVFCDQGEPGVYLSVECGRRTRT